MADKKITELTELAEAPAVGDLIPLVDISDTTMAASGTDKKITPVNLMAGKTLVTHVVAASGGTHTSLTAALTAASNGDTIWVREGTYTEAGSITSTLTDLTIVGENKHTSTIAMGANALTLSGTRLTLMNIEFTWSTSAFSFSGGDNTIENCRFIRSATTETNVGLTLGTACNFTSNYFESSASTTNTSANDIYAGGSQIRMTNNHFLTNATMPNGQVTLEGNGILFNNNYVSYNGTGTNYFIKFSNAAVVSGNYFYNSGNNGSAILAINSLITISGNVFYNWNKGVDQTGASTGNAQITGNHFFQNTTSIDLNAPRNVVTGNKFSLIGSTCVTLSATADNTVISGNNLYNASTGINVTSSSCLYVSIVGNNFNAVSSPIVDSGIGTLIHSNFGVTPAFEKKVFTMVNGSGTTINAGDVVILKSVAGSDEVTHTTTAGDDKVFGICTNTNTNGQVAYIQTLGKTTVLKADGTTDIAVGDFLTTFTTAGISAKATAGDMVYAIALEAYTTNDSNGVLDALLISPRLI
jgi:hypothetical protein